eukprot:gene3341-3838_t
MLSFKSILFTCAAVGAWAIHYNTSSAHEPSAMVGPMLGQPSPGSLAAVYRAGANNTIQNAGVQYILDTVTDEVAVSTPPQAMLSLPPYPLGICLAPSWSPEFQPDQLPLYPFAQLGKNPDRKFIYVEQAFFQRWWRELDSPTQQKVLHPVLDALC